jgi:hypothetical protein
MGDSTWLEILKQGGYLVVAFTIAYFYRKDSAQWAQSLRDDRDALLHALQNNTDTLADSRAERSEIIRALSRLEAAITEMSNRGRYYDSGIQARRFEQNREHS